MELLQIRLFQYAITLGSFIGAAHFVFSIQSAVSQRIKTSDQKVFITIPTWALR